MAKKKDKKDKEAKKARTAEKQQKAQAKSEKKTKKAGTGDDDDDEGIEEILAKYAQEQEQFEAINITLCDGPSKRLNGAMVASPVHGKRELLLFGGEAQQPGSNNNLSIFYNDLYSYTVDSDQWRKIESRNSPLPRSGHAMCVHPSGIILMFGGEFSSPKQNTFYHYGDTWVLDAQTKEWSKVDYKKGPSPRSGHRLTYWKNYILLHGGFRDLASSTTYLSDLWAFDVTSYQWSQIEMPPNHPVPDARSGHSFVPAAEGAVVWGGYSKVKASKGLQRGKVHTDVWTLKMKQDLKSVRWERRKKSGFAPSPRVGCSMVYHKGRGVLFGGVYDTDETEESLQSNFFNSLHAYQVEMNRWFPLSLRQPRKKKNNNAGPTKSKAERQADLEANLSQVLKSKLGFKEGEENDKNELFDWLDDDENASSNDPTKDNSDEEAASATKEYPIINTLPHPRFNASTAVVDDLLFIFGGVWEKGDREFTLDSMYSVDLNKLDGLKVYWEDLTELEEAERESDEEEDDDDDYDEGDEDEDDEEVPLDEEDDEAEADGSEEEQEDEEESTETIPDPRPWLPHPKPFETLKAFYQRTAPKFLEWSLSQNKEARGKDLKRIAFELSEERWWERREEVRIAEDQMEELGGVGDIIEKDQSTRTKARR